MRIPKTKHILIIPDLVLFEVKAVWGRESDLAPDRSDALLDLLRKRFSVTAQDAFSNTVTTYTGTAKVTSTDAKAVLPANPVFVGGVASNVQVTLKTAGTQSVTATDTTRATLTATGSTTVIANSATSYVLSGLAATVAAGTQTTLTVTAVLTHNCHSCPAT